MNPKRMRLFKVIVAILSQLAHMASYIYTRNQAWGKHLGQMLEALPQVLGKVRKHKHKCFIESIKQMLQTQNKAV